ncbi:MAG: hypothetical protein ACRD1V_01315, partial [Vicinamibacterales bacterium]
ATVIAAAAAMALYYAWFIPTYRLEFARIGHETATAAVAAGNRTIGDRAKAVPYFVDFSFGIPVLALSILGAFDIRRRHIADRLALTLAGWMVGCGLFLIVGIVTPVDMRYYLAAIPAIALLAAAGAAAAWRRDVLWRAVSIALLTGTVIVGVARWWAALG